MVFGLKKWKLRMIFEESLLTNGFLVLNLRRFSRTENTENAENIKFMIIHDEFMVIRVINKNINYHQLITNEHQLFFPCFL